jgi:ceramide glucosyltransferase
VVLVKASLGFLALLSLALTLWQWWVARRFPLHQRARAEGSPLPVTVLKPLKGCDQATEECLRSWFAQEYGGPLQLVFGAASAQDPVCAVVEKLRAEFPSVDAELKVCGALAGANLKASKLAEMQSLAKHDVIAVSDADVWIAPDFLKHFLPALRDSDVGLVCSFYRMARPHTLAMRWEALAVNADFWSQVLQARSLKPLDFALGAVMAARRSRIEAVGGFAGLANCLADDYQLGNRIARGGDRVELATVVAECRSAPMGWREVWKHQLRWARTIRVCQPLPYFFSLLANATLWPLSWLAAAPGTGCLAFLGGCLVVRIATAADLETRMTQRRGWAGGALAPAKDLFQAAIWLLAFIGNRVEWRGERLRVRRGGMLERIGDHE